MPDQSRRFRLVTPPPEQPTEGRRFRLAQEAFDLPELKGVINRRIGELKGGASPFGPNDPAQGEQVRRLIGMGMALQGPRSPLGKADALAEADPSLRFGTDPLGNIFVEGDFGEGPQRFFINAPGPSGQDVSEFVVEGLFQAPLVLAGAGLGGAALGTAGRIGGAALGAGSGSALRDVASGQPIDPRMAAFSAGTAGLFEGVAPLVANVIGRVLRSRSMFSGGRLTPRGRQVLTRAGIDPDSVTNDFVREFRKAINQADDPVQAAAVAEAQSLPRPVPLSRGDVTRSPIAAGEEQAALAGARGKEALEAAALLKGTKPNQGVTGTQTQALLDNLSAIQSRLGGGARTVTEAGQGAARAQAALVAQRDALKASATSAFETARQARAGILTPAVRDLGRILRRSFNESFNPATAPKVSRLIDQFKGFERRFPGRVASVNVRALENWRQVASAMQRSNDPVEQAAAGHVLRAFDDYLDEIAETAAVRGDPGAIEAFRNARGLWRQLRQKFSDNRIIADILKTGPDGALVTPPSEALNRVFTASGLGQRKDAVQALTRIRRLLGPESPEWLALKEEGFLRLARTQRPGGTTNVLDLEAVSGARFSSELNTALTRSPELMKVLYTPQETALLRQFATVAQRATVPPRGAVNPSGSAFAIERTLSRMGFIGQKGVDLARAMLRGLRQEAANRAARQSFGQALPPPRPQLPPGIGGVLGAPAGQVANERLLR